jgi:23S rRNA (pseudouridine1915-N3)-methyltransferase
VLAVGRIGAAPEGALVARYAARMRPGLRVVEVPDGRGSPTEIIRREAAALRARIPAGAFVVALDRSGEASDSAALARHLAQWSDGRTPCFLIGGAAGLDPQLCREANHLLSLGPMVWPHLLARAMLAEQLFRAQTILAGHPYHRGPREPGEGKKERFFFF